MTPLSRNELEARRQRYLDRAKRYQDLGHDPLGVPRLVLDNAGSLEGPVLDLGTGKGVTARELARRGFSVVSVDISSEEQELASFLTDDPDLRARIEFVQVDGTRLPFGDGEFGAAVTVNAIHHLADGVPTLRELLRVVRPGGTVVLADFSPEGFSMVAQVHRQEGGEHAEGPVTLDWARGYLRALGASEETLREERFTRIATLRRPPRDAGLPLAELDREGVCIVDHRNGLIRLRPIGTVRTPHPHVAQMPIQPRGAMGVQGTIEIARELVDGLADLEGFSHIILIYAFHGASPPRLRVTPFLDATERGVFATRAPTRPNPIGISVVRLISVRDNLLEIENVDILDGTPLLDIKPYVPAFDAWEPSSVGWLSEGQAKVETARADERFDHGDLHGRRKQ